MNIVDRLRKVYEVQSHRYQKKGAVRVLAGFLLIFAIMKAGITLGYCLYPENIQHTTLWFVATASAVHTGSAVLSFLIYLPGYLGLSSFHQRYMTNKRASWPWQRENWGQTLRKTVSNLFLNQMVIFPPMVAISASRYRFGKDDGFPSLLLLFGQVMLMYFIQDFITYWNHRFLHTYPTLYRVIHKQHHEYDKVHSFAYQYTHPVQFMLISIIPSSIALLLAAVVFGQLHAFSALFWIFWKSTVSLEEHSGFQFPWSITQIIPLNTGSSYHDHHHSNNVGNYAGSCYFWDVVLGTADDYFKVYLKDKKV